MATNLGNRLATQAAAEEQGIVPAKAGGGSLSVLGWINDAKTLGEIAKALPRGLDAARFMRQVQTEIRKNPALLEADPRSFILGVLTTAQLGLELGPLGQAYLTGPFKLKDGRMEAVLIIGYKGLCELAYRSDTIDLIDAVTVHAGEPFAVVGGTNPHIDHEIRLECRENPAVAYYAIAVPKGGGRIVFDVMTPTEVERIKGRSKSAGSAVSPWKSDYEAMAQKTVIRRLLNRGRVRLSPQVQEAIADDEIKDLGLDKAALLDPAMMPVEPAPVAEPSADEAAGQASVAAAAGAPDPATDQPQEAAAARTAATDASADPGAAFRPKAAK